MIQGAANQRRALTDTQSSRLGGGKLVAQNFNL